MDLSSLLQIFKDKLGITSDVRDKYLKNILKSVIDELEKEKGIKIDETNMSHTMFIIDYAAFYYESGIKKTVSNNDANNKMPRHLQFRLNNLFIKSGIDKE